MSMAKEFGSRGVTVNAVAPGFIESDMTAELPEAIVEGVMKNIPAGRFGKPEEVADLVKFLALEDGAVLLRVGARHKHRRGIVLGDHRPRNSIADACHSH